MKLFITMAASLLVLASITTAYTREEKLQMIQNYLNTTPRDEVIANLQDYATELMADDGFMTYEEKLEIVQNYLKFTPQEKQVEDVQNFLNSWLADDEESDE